MKKIVQLANAQIIQNLDFYRIEIANEDYLAYQKNMSCLDDKLFGVQTKLTEEYEQKVLLYRLQKNQISLADYKKVIARLTENNYAQAIHDLMLILLRVCYAKESLKSFDFEINPINFVLDKKDYFDCKILLFQPSLFQKDEDYSLLLKKLLLYVLLLDFSLDWQEYINYSEKQFLRLVKKEKNQNQNNYLVKFFELLELDNLTTAFDYLNTDCLKGKEIVSDIDQLPVLDYQFVQLENNLAEEKLDNKSNKEKVEDLSLEKEEIQHEEQKPKKKTGMKKITVGMLASVIIIVLGLLVQQNFLTSKIDSDFYQGLKAYALSDYAKSNLSFEKYLKRNKKQLTKENQQIIFMSFLLNKQYQQALDLLDNNEAGQSVYLSLQKDKKLALLKELSANNTVIKFEKAVLNKNSQEIISYKDQLNKFLSKKRVLNILESFYDLYDLTKAYQLANEFILESTDLLDKESYQKANLNLAYDKIQQKDINDEEKAKLKEEIDKQNKA